MVPLRPRKCSRSSRTSSAIRNSCSSVVAAKVLKREENTIFGQLEIERGGVREEIHDPQRLPEARDAQ